MSDEVSRWHPRRKHSLMAPGEGAIRPDGADDLGDLAWFGDFRRRPRFRRNHPGSGIALPAAVASAAKMNMNSPVSAEELVEICRDGVARFPAGSELYIKPLMWAEDGWIYPDPESTRFAVNIFEASLPAPSGSSCCRAFRRPAPDQAPTDAKSPVST